MNQTIPVDHPVTAEAAPASPGPRTGIGRGSRMRQSRLLGALFIAGFLAYGTGSALATSIVGHPNFLASVPPVQSLLALGAFLIVLNTAVDIGKASLLFPILQRHSVRTAVGYLATMVVEVAFLGVGALALLLIIPLAEHAGDPGAQTLGSILVALNSNAYQLGEMTLGVGATVLCLLLLRTRLVPGWLAVSGLIGYAFLVAGAIAEVFGVHIGLALTLPGFFFELALPIWLFTKGFRPQPFQGPATPALSA